jgi:hypothetical protein
MIDRVKNERLFLAAGVACALISAAQAGPLRPVALTGTSGPLGPGLGAGVQFSNFGMTGLQQAAPQLTGTGYISFTATLSGSGVTGDNNEAHFANRGHGLEVLARKGSQAAGLDAGVVYTGFIYEPTLSDAGKTAFQGIISGPDVSFYTNDCVWAEPAAGGPLDILIREHVTIAPGTGGTLLGDQFNINWPTPTMWGNYWIFMGRNGTLLQRSSIHSNGDPQWGIFNNPGGVLNGYIIRGVVNTDPEPDVAFYGAANWYINEHGATCSGRIDSLVGNGIWTDTAVDSNGYGAPGLGQLHPVAQSGQLAPGSIERWEQFQKWSQNKNGRVAFAAAFTGIPMSGGGIWSDGRFGVMQAIALTGGTAPGAGTATFNVYGVGIVDEVLIADNNSTSFMGHLAQTGGVGGGNDQGIWSNRSTATGLPGNLRKVMREGDPVPSGMGADYEGLNFSTPLNFWVNGTGRVCFFGLLNDFTRAVFIEQPDGSFRPVVKEFTTLDVLGDGSDIRTISNITVVAMSASSGDGRRTIYNDNGDVVVRLRFTDNSEGIFTTAPAPPAPCGNSDFNGDGDFGTDQDIEAFFQCLAGNCCAACWEGGSDFNGDGDFGTDQDIESFFRVLAGGNC